MTTRSRRRVRSHPAVESHQAGAQGQRTESPERLRDSPSILCACVARRAKLRRRQQHEGQVQNRGKLTAEGIPADQASWVVMQRMLILLSGPLLYTQIIESNLQTGELHAARVELESGAAITTKL